MRLFQAALLSYSSSRALTCAHGVEKARVQEPPNLQGLVKEIEPHALGKNSCWIRRALADQLSTESIPAGVREEIEDLIKKFVEKNVED